MAVRTSKTCSSNSCIAEQQDTTTTFYQIKTPDLMSLSVLLFCPPFCLPPLSIFTLCLSAPLVLSFPSMQPALLLGGEGLPPLPHCLLPLRTWVVFQCPPLSTFICSRKTRTPLGSKGHLELLSQTWLLPVFGSEMGCDTILAMRQEENLLRGPSHLRDGVFLALDLIVFGYNTWITYSLTVKTVQG